MLTIAAMQAARARLAGDPHRPRWHFAPPGNWLNDPNGLIQWRGTYHLCYQYHPSGPLWGDIHWGHATSRDLTHWDDAPLALAPTPGGPDADGCWSGVAVDDGGVPTVIYTGVAAGQERPCLATGDDDLIVWRKYPGNPVIAAPPPGLDLVGFRDHALWRQDGQWQMAIGAGVRGVGGAALRYTSPDLRAWAFAGPLCAGDGGATGEMWECPDFFALGDRHALVVSTLPARRVLGMLGDYDGARFVPQQIAPLDAGRAFYAPQSCRDDRGRRIMIGWLPEARPDADLVAAGWAGMMSAPREIMARPEGGLGMAPAAEISALRRQGWHATDLPLAPATPLPCPLIPGGSFEARLTLAPGAARRIALTLYAGGEPLTTIAVDRAAQTLAVPAGDGQTTMPLALAPGADLRLVALVDRSVIEVFANDRACATQRVYPANPDDLRLVLSATGDAATVRALDAWELRAG